MSKSNNDPFFPMPPGIIDMPHYGQNAGMDDMNNAACGMSLIEEEKQVQKRKQRDNLSDPSQPADI